MMDVTTVTTYSTPEAARRAGITYRVLDYWVRTGLVVSHVPTTGSGVPREFTGEDLRLIVTLAKVAQITKERAVLFRVATAVRGGYGRFAICWPSRRLVGDPDSDQLEEVALVVTVT